MTADTITPNHDVQSLSDRELLERVFRHLEHLDGMVHETHQAVAELRPLIPRALALLDPMAKIRRKDKHV